MTQNKRVTSFVTLFICFPPLLSFFIIDTTLTIQTNNKGRNKTSSLQCHSILFYIIFYILLLPGTFAEVKSKNFTKKNERW